MSDQGSVPGKPKKLLKDGVLNIVENGLNHNEKLDISFIVPRKC